MKHMVSSANWERRDSPYAAGEAPVPEGTQPLWMPLNQTPRVPKSNRETGKEIHSAAAFIQILGITSAGWKVGFLLIFLKWFVCLFKTLLVSEVAWKPWKLKFWERRVSYWDSLKVSHQGLQHLGCGLCFRDFACVKAEDQESL